MKLRMYALVASFEPLVVFANHHNGHVEILKDDDTMHSTWSFAEFDAHMARTRGEANFFGEHVYPQYRRILRWVLGSAEAQFRGAAGHFDLLCLDLAVQSTLSTYRVQLLGIRSGCDLPGIQDKVAQRQFMVVHAMETVLDVQKAVLSDTSVLSLLDDDLKTSHGFFELAYSNQPGAAEGLEMECPGRERQQFTAKEEL